MKNELTHQNGIFEELVSYDDGSNTVSVNGAVLAQSAWVGSGNYTFTSGSVTVSIRRVASVDGNVLLLKEDDNDNAFYVVCVSEGGGGEVDVENAAITFTQASSRTEINSGDTVKTLFGKIKKWLADLKTVAFTGSYRDLSNKPTIPAAVRVKGNAESSYRTGDVNLTPANIGAVNKSGDTMTGNLEIATVNALPILRVGNKVADYYGSEIVWHTPDGFETIVREGSNHEDIIVRLPSRDGTLALSDEITTQMKSLRGQVLSTQPIYMWGMDSDGASTDKSDLFRVDNLRVGSAVTSETSPGVRNVDAASVDAAVKVPKSANIIWLGARITGDSAGATVWACVPRRDVQSDWVVVQGFWYNDNYKGSVAFRIRILSGATDSEYYTINVYNGWTRLVYNGETRSQTTATKAVDRFYVRYQV